MESTIWQIHGLLKLILPSDSFPINKSVHVHMMVGPSPALTWQNGITSQGSAQLYIVDPAIGKGWGSPNQ